MSKAKEQTEKKETSSVKPSRSLDGLSSLPSRPSLREPGRIWSERYIRIHVLAKWWSEGKEWIFWSLLPTAISGEISANEKRVHNKILPRGEVKLGIQKYLSCESDTMACVLCKMLLS